MPRLYDLLREHHEKLDRVFDHLVERTRAGDAAAADETWTEFERELLAHMEAEEKFILPLLDQSAPADAAHVRNEHEHIRAMLHEMGISLELHTLPAEKVHSFVQFLREHATKEEASLYPFADRFLSEDQKHGLLERLREIAVKAIDLTGP
jgi:hemerythrin superfamily protein